MLRSKGLVIDSISNVSWVVIGSDEEYNSGILTGWGNEIC